MKYACKNLGFGVFCFSKISRLLPHMFLHCDKIFQTRIFIEMLYVRQLVRQQYRGKSHDQKPLIIYLVFLSVGQYLGRTVYSARNHSDTETENPVNASFKEDGREELALRSRAENLKRQRSDERHVASDSEKVIKLF